MFLACRHHSAELIAKNVWYKLFPADKSPECKLFAELRGSWDYLDKSKETQKVDLPEEVKENLREFYTDLYMRGMDNEGNFIRGDYRELAEICLESLGVKLPDGKEFRWRKVGAIHKARFLAYAITSLKANSFSNDPALGYSEERKDILRRFTAFNIQFYIPHFFMASTGSDAAHNDLKLYKDLLKYKKIDQVIADEALKTLSRHLWYLSDLTVPLALFSEKVDQDTKARMAAKLIMFREEDNESKKLEKPTFPDISEKTELYDLITSNSPEFFTIIGVDDNWLQTPVEEWDRSDAFNSARRFARTAKTANNVAERAVKLATEYSNVLTKDGSFREWRTTGGTSRTTISLI